MKRLTKLIVILLSLIMLLTSCGKQEPGKPAVTEAPASATQSSEEAAETAAVPTEEVVEVVYAPAGKDNLIVAGKTEPTALDPATSNQVTNFMIMNLFYDRLVYMTNDGAIEPMLAKSWEWIDDLTLRVHLRDDALFHNGTKLTSEDVVYSIQRACEMPVSKSTFSSFDGPNTVAVDEYTVDIKVKEPSATALTVLTHGRGNIVSKQLMEEVGSDVYGLAPVGTGKFKFVEWVPGDHITMTRNDDYWGDKPAFKDLTIRFVTEDASRAIELETGAVDVSLQIGANDIDRLTADKNLKTYVIPSSQVTLFQITQLNFDTLDDVRVREAMHLALDLDAIIKTAYRGQAMVATSLLPPGTFGYTELGPSPYDPEKAKALIAESGFDTNQVITLTIVANDTIATAVAEMAQNMWKAVGLNVEIVSVDRATMTTNNNKALNLMCYTQTTTIGFNPETALLMWERPTNGYHNDPEIYKMLAGVKNILDDNARQAEYHKILKYLWDTHIVIPIAVPNMNYGTAAYIQNFPASPANMPDFSLVTFTPAK